VKLGDEIRLPAGRWGFFDRSYSAPPAINLKPVSGGVEIAVRYITRATERYEMRSRLYQAGMNLISKKGSQDSLNVVKVVQP
jgi:hypothetical protein